MSEGVTLLSFRLGQHRAAVSSELVLRVVDGKADVPRLAAVLGVDEPEHRREPAALILSSGGERHSVGVDGPLVLLDADASTLLPLPEGVGITGAIGALLDGDRLTLVLDSRVICSALKAFAPGPGTQAC